MARFSGKVAMVTGGSSGMGYATALRLAKEGAKVVVSARNEERLIAAVKKINEEASSTGEGGSAIAVVANATKEYDAKKTVETAVSSFGKLDIAFLNAGLFGGAPITETTEEQLDEILNLNVKGTFFALKHSMLAMKEAGNGGSIIVNSSGMSTAVSTRMISAAAYAASKSFMDTVVKYAGMEGAAYKVRVNSVNPGIVRTGIMGEEMQKNVAGFDGFASGHQIVGRAGTPEEVASLVCYLASDEATLLIGTNIIIDGGFSFGPAPAPSAEGAH